MFDGDQARTLLDSDRCHWWFRAKAAIVATAVQQHCDRAAPGWLVDLGAGAGGVTARLGWAAGRTLAVEGRFELAEQGRRRHRFQAVAATASSVPVADRAAEVVTLLDVLEHVERPGLLLDEARRILGPTGLLVVTVPAHQWLWSGADELLGHVKRYNRELLTDELEAAGFHVVSCSHVFSWLVPAVWLQRAVTRDPKRQLGLGVESPLIDRVASALARLEQRVTSRVSLPLGTSVLAVARPAQPSGSSSRCSTTKDHSSLPVAAGPRGSD
ncbi:MAG: class I SAM-dependent methyltransferase [Actinomycetota bacterium]|nr:class I SAM-dependent methyltransferase [Actinomycetota bacterium]